MHGIKAVSLDFWGTLVRESPTFVRERGQMLRERFAPRVSAHEFFVALALADRAADQRAQFTGVHQDFEDRLHQALSSLMIEPPARGSEALRQALAEQAVLLHAHPPEIIETRAFVYLGDLILQYPVVITANTGMIPAQAIPGLLDQAGFPAPTLTGIVTDQEVQGKGRLLPVKGAKPSKAIFQRTLDTLRSVNPSLRRSEVLHIGDNYTEDVEGAKRFGFQARHVNAVGCDPIGGVLHALTYDG